MAALEKITTTYAETEDRLRLAGADADGRAVVLWLTRRLADRLVRTLTQWLENTEGEDGAERRLPADLRHAWAQEAAQRQLQPSAPVRADADAPAALVESVDLARGDERYSIGFRHGADCATLNLSSLQLRQWLGILRTLYLAADWPLTDWPRWMEEEPRPQARAALLH